MPIFTTIPGDTVTDAQALELYASVDWSAYTGNPATLRRALDNSSFVVTARDDQGNLVGLARALSDDATICYLQDILVAPPFQARGVGRALLDRVTARYAHVRQTVLITDDEPAQRKFYEALGFTEGSDITPGALRMFARFR